MNAFLVITGALIISLIAALFIVKKFNIKRKIFGIPLQYVLDIALLFIAVVIVVVVKNALSGKNKTITALLNKLQINMTQNKINIVNDAIKEKTDNIASIDQQIKAIQPATQQSSIDALVAQQNSVKQELDDLNKQKQTHVTTQTTLQQQIKDLSSL